MTLLKTHMVELSFEILPKQQTLIGLSYQTGELLNKEGEQFVGKKFYMVEIGILFITLSIMITPGS